MKDIKVLEKILCDIFQKKLEDVKKLSYEENDEWDSLKHMEIIVSLEDKLGLELSEDQMLEITTYNKILHLVAQR